MRRLALTMALVTLGGCGDDSPAADAGAIDASDSPDAELADADTTPDAFDPCPGASYFTGEYVDWDSDLVNFVGVPLADMVERGNPSNTEQTSPNGRWELCVAAGVDADFDVTQTDYMDLILAMDAVGHTMAVATVRGLTPARRATLFSGELGGATYDPADAIVEVDLRRANGDPVTGATVTLGSASDAMHAADGTHVFGNVAVGGGTVTITVTPPGGTTCVGRGEIPVAAGALSAAPFACN